MINRLNYHLSFLMRSLLIAWFVINALLISHCLADTSSDSTDQSYSTDDGPHVFRDNDSTVLVFYLCDSVIDSARFDIQDTLQFPGRCFDTGQIYTIVAHKTGLEPSIFKKVSTILTVSDIHGEYEYFENILQAAGVIDEQCRWIWGDGHLVINGDVFDRGDKVTECLWLIYQLEHQARAAGGQVHFLLGNHELMIMRGDNRYIHDKYLKGICRKTRIQHEDLYGPDMELGRWLRTKNTAIKINDILFVHAGLAPEFVKRNLSQDEINDYSRAGLDLTSSRVALSEMPRFLYGSMGPFWYRGYFYEMEGRYPQVTSEEIDDILNFYNVQTVVVGHTGVDQVMGLYDNRVIAIDVPFEELECLQALLWQEDSFYRVTGSGTLEKIK